MTTRMNPWVKRKWVRALRSGEYEQGGGSLICGRGGHCCLGVLAREMVPEFCVDPRVDDDRGLYLDGYVRATRRGRKEHCVVPDDMAVLWGLDEDTQNDLANMNDGRWTFRQIAAWIERNL